MRGLPMHSTGGRCLWSTSVLWWGGWVDGLRPVRACRWYDAAASICAMSIVVRFHAHCLTFSPCGRGTIFNTLRSTQLSLRAEGRTCCMMTACVILLYMHAHSSSCAPFWGPFWGGPRGPVCGWLSRCVAAQQLMGWGQNPQTLDPAEPKGLNPKYHTLLCRSAAAL